MLVETILVGSAAVMGVRKAIKHHKSKRQLRDMGDFGGGPQSSTYGFETNTSKSRPRTIRQNFDDTNGTGLLGSTRASDSLSEASYTSRRPPSYRENDIEWRRVYLFERSTSKAGYNHIRVHRALFVGDLNDGVSSGRTYEIRKTKASFLGLLSRDMTFTDAEQWLGSKTTDRKPVFLGYTRWTDEELNSEGTRMCADYHTYSLTYSNCQHFVCDLAEKIIPDFEPGARLALQPLFDRLCDEIKTAPYTNRSNGLLAQVADMSIDTARNTTKFFHFVKAAVKSAATLSFQPFDEHLKWMADENRRRDIAGYLRQQRRLAALSPQNSGSSSSRLLQRRITGPSYPTS